VQNSTAMYPNVLHIFVLFFDVLHSFVLCESEKRSQSAANTVMHSVSMYFAVRSS